jgi:putative hydrolase of the HAD superfamily
VKKAVIFDLGGTLASYWPRAQWPAVLREAIGEVSGHLRTQGRLRVDAEELRVRTQRERGEDDDRRVRPLIGRLANIFRLSGQDLADGRDVEMCRAFLMPIFARGRVCDDALPTLKALRGRGLRTGILSNTPWGSPAELWREELDRLGLSAAVDAVVFCMDAGYRKPAPQPFERICRELHAAPGECLFVGGDDPRWDIAGPRGVGMEAVLIDRTGDAAGADEASIRSLTVVLERLDR